MRVKSEHTFFGIRDLLIIDDSDGFEPFSDLYDIVDEVDIFLTLFKDCLLLFTIFIICKTDFKL